MVAGEYEGEGWCRAVLLETKNDEHKIAFVDYGQLAHVAEVRPVPKQFRNFPWFSCVCTCSRETVKKFSVSREVSNEIDDCFDRFRKETTRCSW